MPEARLLLFGVNGQVGRELRRVLPELGTLIAIDRSEADLAEPAALRKVVRRHRPETIVNAAAFTAVDQAEDEPARAWAINVVAPGVLSEEAAAVGASWVHYSTDYVFDGRQEAPYRETDAPAPLSVYGRTKLEGERAVQSGCARHLILRTSWVFSPHGKNFLKTMLRLAGERETLEVVADQYGAPTSARTIAEVTATLLGRLRGAPADDPRWGVYHIASAGETTWHEYARYVITRARELGMPLRTTPEAVIPVSASEYPTRAKRPANSRLDTSRLRSTFGVELPEWSHDVTEVLTQMTCDQT